MNFREESRARMASFFAALRIGNNVEFFAGLKNQIYLEKLCLEIQVNFANPGLRSMFKTCAYKSPEARYILPSVTVPKMKRIENLLSTPKSEEATEYSQVVNGLNRLLVK